MLTTTTQVADAACFPRTSHMADIIDSLKRLERIGSEGSKTVQKIIESAREIESAIVELYLGFEMYEGTTIYTSSILDKLIEEYKSAPGYVAPPEEPKTGFFKPDPERERICLELGASCGVSYRIDRLGGRYGLCRGHSGKSVSEDRESALNFSEDLANGLLILIERDLESRQRENIDALRILEHSASRLKKT